MSALPKNDSSVAEQTSKVFILNEYCFETIFDYLALSDVSAIGLTCKRLQQVTGQYFAHFYPLHQVRIERNENGQIVEFLTSSTNLGRYAEDLAIVGDDVGVIRYAAKIKSKYLKSITFRDLENYSASYEEYIKTLVENVESVTFDKCFQETDAIYYEEILKHCVNLKCLEISKIQNFNVQVTFPKLEHVIIRSYWCHIEHWYWCDIHMSDLKQFLQQNLHIKKLSIIAETPMIERLLKFIVDVDVKLEELQAVYDEIGDPDGFDNDHELSLIHKQLKILYEQGKYKEVEVHLVDRHLVDYYVEIDNTPGITKIIVDFYRASVCKTFVAYQYGEEEVSDDDALRKRCKFLTSLSALKSLCVIGIMYTIEAEILSEGLTKLECLRLDLKPNEDDTNYRSVVSTFALRAPKLKEIIFNCTEFDCNNLKLEDINKARQNLPNAQKLTIYLPEKDFLAFQSRNMKLSYELIRVKRLVDCIQSPISEIENVTMPVHISTLCL